MKANHLSRSNAGTTLVEMVLAISIFSTTMVYLLGTMVTISNHNQLSEQEAMALSFNRSALEDLRGLPIDELLAYQFPVDNRNTGTVTIPGFGDGEVHLYAIIPPQFEGGFPYRFELGLDDPAWLVDVPNPIEIQVEVVKQSDYSSSMSYPDGGETYPGATHSGSHYFTSTMISY